MSSIISGDRNFSRFVVFAEETILTALGKITANQSRLIFVVSESGILQVYLPTEILGVGLLAVEALISTSQ